MSLSGLDSPAVEAAYQTVLEKNGWFLLHYTSRDAVKVLAQGVKGVAEMREAAEEHCKTTDDQAPTPLFGVIHFRRRKVLVKLILHGSSRLIQARAQVHWGSITTRFTNHDSTCEITHPDQLTENALTANTDLHSSRSPAVSANAKKPALGGIEESMEDSGDRKVQSASSLKPPAPPSEEPISENIATAAVPEVPSAEPEEKPQVIPVETQSITAEEPARSESLSSSKPLSELVEPLDLSFLDKPKVKLAPRPTHDKRSTARRTSQDGRSTAALPAGLRINRPGNVWRPQSRDSTHSTMTVAQVFPPPPIPETPTHLQRPKSSSGSVKSLPATLPKSSAMTKERQRLMKFREMYKQKDMKTKAKGKGPANLQPVIPEEQAPSSSKFESTPDDLNEPEKEPLREENEQSLELADASTYESLSPSPPPEEEFLILQTPEDHSIEKSDDEATPTAETGKIAEHASSDPQKPTAEKSVNLKPEPVGVSDSGNSKVETPTTTEHVESETCSPTSILEFSGQTSTRPTSVSEVSEQIAPETASGQSLNPVDKQDATVNGVEAHEHEDTQTDTEEATPTPLTPTTAQQSPAPAPIQVSVNGDEVPQAYEETDVDSTDRLQPPSATSQTLTSPSASSAEDDELINELQTAEVKEATPVSVSKSPISAFIPRNAGFRLFSAPLTSTDSEASVSKSPGVPMMRLRSTSNNSPAASTTITALPAVASAADNVTVNKKVEGGIAAKIADLQRSFSRNSSATATPLSSSKFVSQRASMLHTDVNTSPISFTTPKRISNLISRKAIPTPEETPQSSTEPSTAQPLPKTQPLVAPDNSGPLTPVSPKRSSKRDSFSFRSFMKPIIREPEPPTPVDTPAMEHPSTPVMVPSHHRTRSSASVRQPYHPSARSASVSSFRSITGSRSHPGSPTPGHQEIFGSAGSRRSIDGWRSFGRRKSESKGSLEPGILPRNTSSSSLDTTLSADSASKEKKASRTARLLKRMSSTITSLANGPRSQLQTWNERAGQEEVEKRHIQRPIGTQVGDLNVQFPDTLLWKRRWVEIDDQGYLTLKPNSGTERAHGITKRFHMNEFQPPFPPDLDRQELPNSIILDFRDGRTLQCACQSPAAQRETLNLLLEYHRAWIS